MRTITIAAAVLGFTLASAHAQAPATTFFNACGNGFSAGFIHRGVCHSYIAGYADGLTHAQRYHPCFRRGVTDQQLVMIVQAYMRNHPERLDEPTDAVIGEAFVKAFPCP